jgi:hypothetical protein
MQVAKKGHAFFIYVLPMLDVESRQHEIPFSIPRIQGHVRKEKCQHLTKTLAI